MALNIAVPLSGVGGLSPISPIGIDCWENIKILVSPIGSESSGVSSLDSEEAKQQLAQQHQKSPPPCSPEDLQIFYNGRDILDLAKNVDTNNQKLWNLRYTYLPENNNIPMFLANRSQYHRLGANGHIQEYSLVKCEDCDFEYPINSSRSFFCQTSVTYSPTTNSAMTYTGFNTILNHHQNYNNYNKNLNNNYRQQQQIRQQQQQNHNRISNNNNNSNNIYHNQINNISDNFFSNNYLKKTTNHTNNSTTTTPTRSLTPSILTAATSPTSSSGYSSSSSIGGKYQAHNNHNANNNNNNNTVIKAPSIISRNNYNNFYSFLNSFNNTNNNNNIVNNNNNNNNHSNTTNNSPIANIAANFNNINNNFNYSNNNNNNSNNNNGSFINGQQQQQNYARMYKYF